MPPCNHHFDKSAKQSGQSAGTLAMTAPDLALVINSGSLTVKSGKAVVRFTQRPELENMDWDVTIPVSLQAKLQGSASVLTLHRGGHEVVIQDLGLNGSLKASEHKVQLFIDDLNLARPEVQLKGELTLGSTSPVFEVDLYGSILMLMRSECMALAMTGGTTPTKEIFNYLRGGTVPKISVYSQGEHPLELGDLRNLRIAGQLQAGAVSIPEIQLDLTEVNGDVVIADGVLQGTGVSTRLEGSFGHDGTLKVGLLKATTCFNWNSCSVRISLRPSGF